MERPTLRICCPYCSRQATHRADTQQEAAEFLGRWLTEHLDRLHPAEITAERRAYPIEVLQS